jgi:hypothetical protein
LSFWNDSHSSRDGLEAVAISDGLFSYLFFKEHEAAKPEPKANSRRDLANSGRSLRVSKGVILFDDETAVGQLDSAKIPLPPAIALSLRRILRPYSTCGFLPFIAIQTLRHLHSCFFIDKLWFY